MSTDNMGSRMSGKRNTNSLVNHPQRNIFPADLATQKENKNKNHCHESMFGEWCGLVQRPPCYFSWFQMFSSPAASAPWVPWGQEPLIAGENNEITFVHISSLTSLSCCHSSFPHLVLMNCADLCQCVKAEVLTVPLDCCSPANRAAFSFYEPIFTPFENTGWVPPDGYCRSGTHTVYLNTVLAFSFSVSSRLPVHSHWICSLRKPSRLPEEESGAGDRSCLCQGARHRFHFDLSAAAAVRCWCGDGDALS